MLHRMRWTAQIGAAVAVFAAAAPSNAAMENFDGVGEGIVVTGEAPGGGTIPGNTYFPDFSLTGTNNGSGPNSLIIFNSAAPTGNDSDLGSPNQACPGGGPGVGAGGAPGAPGENCVSLNHVLIIAGNITDANHDNVVDDPNDEAGGGEMVFDFYQPVQIGKAEFLDIDIGETVTITFYNGNDLAGTKDIIGLGNNAYHDVDLSLYDTITRMNVEFSSSGSIASVNYKVETTSTESTSWGDVKNKFR